MDYIGSKCPVCNRYFHADEDVVVCPDCGTPHHRDCYEAIGHCHNEALHAEGYDYAEDQKNNSDSNVVICRSCGKENDKNSFFCKYCAAPLSKEDEQQRPGAAGAGNSVPFNVAFMDPLGGVPADTDMGDGVTAGELAKYVKQNTPYFLRVFNNIKSFNRSKFSFCALLFAGGYLLYRKMYRIGALVTALQLLITGMTVYINIAYREEFKAVQNNSGSFIQMLGNIRTLPNANSFIMYLYYILLLVSLVMSIVIGATANRLYYKHCRQQIVKIKNEPSDDGNPENALQTRGGVNMPLALSLLVTNMIINYLSSFYLR